MSVSIPPPSAYGTALDWRRHLPFALWMTLGGVPLLWYVYGPQGIPVELSAKTWQRDIVLERYQQELASGWCDEMPDQAQVQARKTMTDPTGRRQEPTDHCRYFAMQWTPYRSLRTQGEAPSVPNWASSPLGTDTSAKPGAERLGPRHERYEVQLTARADADKQWTCRLNQADWERLQPGLRFRLKVDRWGVADCRSLPPSNG